MTETYLSHSAADTQAWAAELVRRWGPGTVFALHGELGAGKTCLVQGLARALGLEALVNSPTYTLIKEYDGATPLVHIDLYRISGEAEALGLGLEEHLEPPGYTAIEWAERVAELLPATTVHVRLELGDGPEQRRITVSLGAAT